MDRRNARDVTIALYCAGMLGLLFAASPAEAQFITDCDGNGVPDSVELAQGTAEDCDGGGVPDNCETAVAFERRAVETGDPDTWIGWILSSQVGDLDGDGDLDIVASTPSQGLVWYENVDGAGSTGWWIVIAGNTLGTVKLADIDGDSDLDIVIGGDSALLVYKNTDGLATFDQGTLFPWISSYWYMPVQAADLDGDGDLDLVGTGDVSGDPATVAWSENLDGDGTFGPVQVIESFESPNGCYSAVTGDFDGDGDLDVVAADQDSVRLYENEDGEGTFGPVVVVASAVYAHLQSGDLDGDGDLDLVVADFIWPSPSIVYSVGWHENLAGSGTFGPRQIVAEETGWPTVADVDGDGDLDFIAIPYEDRGAAWYENVDGRGTFGPRQEIEEPMVQSYSHDSMAVGDLDGDGDLDMFGSYFLAWFENLTADCDGNSIPDICETDCNSNGRSDICDIRSGPSVDCDADAIPDECESSCPISCDSDGDACTTELDCAPDDPETWSEPGPALNLMVSAGSPTTISWYPPAWSGSVTVRYDTLRSENPADFSLAVCIAGDEPGRASYDWDDPPPGGLYQYLVRVENDCPAGLGALGAGSDGIPRQGRSCP